MPAAIRAESPRAEGRASGWLALAAAAFFLPPAAGLLVVLVTLGFWLFAGARPRRRDLALAVPAAALAVAALGAAAVGSWRQPIAADRFQRRAAAAYAAFWDQLDERARDAAERVAQSTALDEHVDVLAAFAALGRAAAAGPAGAEPGFLLLDAEGSTVAWGGAGLLHEPLSGEGWRERMIRSSFGAATFLVVRPFAPGPRAWRLVAGRSVTVPALPFRLPGGVTAAGWTTAPSRSDLPPGSALAAPGAPTLWIDRAGIAPPLWIERLARLASVPWGLALLGLAATRAAGWRTLANTVLRRRARPGEACALASAAVACLAAGTGASLAATGLAALGTVGALIAAFGLVAAPEAAAWRGIGSLAALALAAFVPWLWPAAASTLATRGGVEGAWLVFGFAAALFAALETLTRPGGERTAGRFAGVALSAALVAAASWQSAEILRPRPEARARAEGARRLSPTALADVAAAVERVLHTADLAALGPAPLESVESEDLAFALWTRSPLARDDLRSALAVSLFDGSRLSTFGLGLPLAAGVLDRSPAVWRDFGLPERSAGPVEGAARLHAGGEEIGSARFWLMPAAAGSGAPLAPEEARRRLLRGTGLAGAPSAETGAPAARPSLAEALDRGGTQALTALVLGAVLLALGVVFSLPLRTFRDGLRRTWLSYSKRLVLVVTLLAVLPVLAINLVLIQAFAARLEREQRADGDDALRAAQRVLGEYVDTLAPGFGLDTVLDDDLLRWLARVVQRDINLYWGSRLYATSQPELFSTALLPRRIPAEIYSRVALGSEISASRTNRVAGQAYLEIYAPFRRGVPAGGRVEALTLSVPLVAQQEDLERETVALRRRALLGTAAFFVLFVVVGARAARNFTRPLQELVVGTQRIAAGATSLDLRPSDAELQALVEAVDRMAAQIAANREQLRRGERLEAWAEMARMIAHEIKNPLTPIRLSAEHMREVYERDPDRFAPVFARCVDNILRQVEELRSIAVEFSTYSSIPKIALERLPLDDALRHAVEAYDSGGGARHVGLDPAGGAAWVRLDPRLFTRALRNVLENAVRVSAGRPVEVVARARDGEARVDVLDRGPGVAADMLERIFDPYFSTHEGGTGLGLPIARRILEEHGGRLWAEAREGGGLRVSMTLPLAVVAERREAEP